MQIVYISNRPEIARETLEYVEHLMTFVDEAIFVCPRDQVEQFRSFPKGRLAITVVAEEELLGDDLERFVLSGDHQIRNWLLRSALCRLDALASPFLMSDDDNRPLREIPVEAFFEDGRYHSYSTYDLSAWKARETDYDLGQHQTRELLQELGYPTLSFSAHMPQIIDKEIFAEVVSSLRDATSKGIAIDEWSVYFNIGASLYPDRFHPPRLFETLCWPGLPVDWDVGVRPETFSFENFYPPFYEEGALFEGIPTAFDAETWGEHRHEKLERRDHLQHVYDSFWATFRRRSAWRAHRLISEAPAFQSFLSRLLPTSGSRLVRDLAQRGDDPAWSFPWSRVPYPRRPPSKP